MTEPTSHIIRTTIPSVRDFRNALAATKLFMGTDESRPSLWGLHVCPWGEYFVIAASDAHRVCRVLLGAHESFQGHPAKHTARIAPKVVPMLIKALPSQLKLAETAATIEVVKAGTEATITVRWIDPDIGEQTAVVPAEYERSPVDWTRMPALERPRPAQDRVKAATQALNPGYIADALNAAKKLLPGLESAVYIYPGETWSTSIYLESPPSTQGPRIEMALAPMRPLYA